MAAWILYVLLVSLLLGLAALAFEQSALMRKKGTRWLWGAGIIASLAMPFVISSVTVQIPSLMHRVQPAAGTPAVALRQMTESALAPAQWIAAAGQENFAWSSTTTTILAGAWAVASVLLLGGLLTSGLRSNVGGVVGKRPASPGSRCWSLRTSVRRWWGCLPRRSSCRVG